MCLWILAKKVKMKMHTVTEVSLRSALNASVSQLEDESIIFPEEEGSAVAGYITLNDGRIAQVLIAAATDRSNWLPDRNAPKK